MHKSYSRLKEKLLLFKETLHKISHIYVDMEKNRRQYEKQGYEFRLTRETNLQKLFLLQDEMEGVVKDINHKEDTNGHTEHITQPYGD